MLRAFAVSALLAVVLLAGCGDDPEVPDPSVDPGFLTTSGAPPLVPPPSATVETLPFSFDGTLGTYAHGCVFPASVCTDGQGTVVAGSTELFLDRPGANLTALTFSLTWQSKSPVTQELWVGAMVMTSCEGCNDTEFPDAHGPSPVTVDVQGVSVPLSAEARVHIYVYNPKGFVHDPAVPAYAGTSVDEPFHIEGTATFLVPPA